MSFSLAQYEGPQQLQNLSLQQRQELSDDIRREILEVVSRKGGHLASGLGCVELAVALHTVFDFRRDRIVWDTGHQAYPHKILTGRLEQFRHLREREGASGFPLRSESAYDAFSTGHTGTAISAALGMAAARDLDQGQEKIVAVVGDGALGNGLSWEGLNNIAVTTRDFILILNDNKMSIAPNVGALSRFLNHIISAPGYNAMRESCADAVSAIPWFGPRLKRLFSRVAHSVKSFFFKGTFFHDLGLRYIGPVDGNDLKKVTEVLARLKKMRGTFLLHIYTRKGKGYSPAENNPEFFHGCGPFDLANGTPGASPRVTFSRTLGDALIQIHKKNPAVVAVTAGMRSGTGLAEFAEECPEAFYDVGITEGHAVTFCCGMAAGGKHPVCAVYASFMQRAVDNVFHDACLQDLPVVFALDRAAAGADGPTHHGILDCACWRSMPHLSVLQPSDAWELRQMLSLAVAHPHPVILRYPAGDAADVVPEHSPVAWGKAEILEEGNSPIALWCVGREVVTGQAVCRKLEQCGIRPVLVNARFLQPFDEELMRRQLAAGMKIAVLENHIAIGGFAGYVAESLGISVLSFGWNRDALPKWGKNCLDQEEIARKIRAAVQEGSTM